MGFCADRIDSKKLIPDKLSCCLMDNIKHNCTTDDLSNCYDLGDSLTNPNSKSGFLVKCHTIKDINACVVRERNEPARDICERKDSLYCLAGGAPRKAVGGINGLSSHILLAYQWALNRSLYRDSLSGAIACYSEEKRSFLACPNLSDELLYSTWNSTLQCKDFFQLGETNDCLLIDKKNHAFPAYNMTIHKNVCKDPNWVNTTEIDEGLNSESDKDERLSKSDMIGLIIGVLSLILTFLALWFASDQFRNLLKKFFSFLFCRKFCKDDVVIVNDDSNISGEFAEGSGRTQGAQWIELHSVNSSSNPIVTDDNTK